VCWALGGRPASAAEPQSMWGAPSVKPQYGRQAVSAAGPGYWILSAGCMLRRADVRGGGVCGARGVVLPPGHIHAAAARSGPQLPGTGPQLAHRTELPAASAVRARVSRQCNSRRKRGCSAPWQVREAPCPLLARRPTRPSSTSTRSWSGYGSAGSACRWAGAGPRGSTVPAVGVARVPRRHR
jgi:hypothetical protein